MHIRINSDYLNLPRVVVVILRRSCAFQIMWVGFWLSRDLAKSFSNRWPARNLQSVSGIIYVSAYQAVPSAGIVDPLHHTFSLSKLIVADYLGRVLEIARHPPG